jgi:predicted amidohydrolase
MKQAANEGCTLAVFPEMADTGYDMEVIEAHAATWDQGPCAAIRECAAALGLHVVCGLSERVANRIFNASVHIDKSGRVVSKYRKSHLFTLVGENDHLGRGESLAGSEIDGNHLGMIICYDVRFPELARSLALQGLDILTVIAAWPTKRIDHWKALTLARAIENQCFVIAVNRTGSDGNLVFGGESRIISPTGDLLATAARNEPTMIVADLEIDELQRVRSSMPVFRDRNPDIYQL